MKQRPGETLKSECFYTRFDEEWKVVEKCHRTKEYELKGSKLGER